MANGKTYPQPNINHKHTAISTLCHNEKLCDKIPEGQERHCFNGWALRTILVALKSQCQMHLRVHCGYLWLFTQLVERSQVTGSSSFLSTIAHPNKTQVMPK